MSLPKDTAYEVHVVNGNNGFGAAFVLSGPTYNTDLAATNANTSAPVLTSASYTFVASDVNDYVYVKSGTNWLPGLYQIVSVNAGAATLGAACASVASPTTGTWTNDYSQSNSANTVFDGTVIAAHTAAATSTIIISGRATFASDVGNVLNITGGVNATTGRYVVNSVSIGVAGVGTWTLDRNCCTAAMTGMTGNMGGAGLTIANVMTDWSTNGTAGSKMFVKGEGTDATTATITINPPDATPNQTTPANRLIGYTNTRGDGGKVTIQATTNTGIKCLSVTKQGVYIENFICDGNSLGTSRGIDIATGGNYCLLRNCVAKNCLSNGFMNSGGTLLLTITDCEATNITGGSAINSVGGTSVFRCYIHDNTVPAINTGASLLASFNLIANNSGASSDGINASAQATVLFNNTIYNCGRDGIRISASGQFNTCNIRNNILCKNGGYGLNFSIGAGMPAVPNFDGNAYGQGSFANTSGTRNNMDDGAAGTTPTNFINLVAPYTNVIDVLIPAGDPFTASGSGDFTLGTNASGAACRGAATPGKLLNATGAGGFLSMGCFQERSGGGPPGIITPCGGDQIIVY